MDSVGRVLEATLRNHIVCSLATPNHFERLLVLGESLATHLPETEFRALIISDEIDVSHYQDLMNRYQRELNPRATHSVMALDDVEFHGFQPVVAAAIYDVAGFAACLKAPLVQHFLAEGWRRVTYLDSDIEVFADFTELLDDSVDISVTPHILRDFPQDGFSPQAADVLRSGNYNTGFVSVTQSGRGVIQWWSNYLQFNSLAQVDQGHFYDQKIMDLVSTVGRLQELRDPGCNVAYWNLHERSLEQSGAEWYVASGDRVSPLYFMHWSGYSLDRPGVLSRHCTRPLVGRQLPRTLLRNYEQSLRQAVLHTPPSALLVGAPTTVPLPAPLRHHLRCELLVHVRSGRTLEEVVSRFTSGIPSASVGSTASRFVEGWSVHPALDGVPNGISVFHRNERAESIRHPYAQLEWATKQLSSKFPERPHLRSAIESSVVKQMDTCAGIQIVGYLTYRAGIAQPPLAALALLNNAGIAVALRRISPGLGDDLAIWSNLLLQHNPLPSRSVSVLCYINFAFWRDHQERLYPFAATPRESLSPVWAWELEELPSVANSIVLESGFASLHGISQWVATNMASQLRCSVSAVTGFELHSISPSQEPLPGLPERYVLASFDAKSVIGRKNPDTLLDVWTELEADFPDVWLVLKSTDVYSLAPTSLLQKLDHAPRTIVIDEVMSVAQMEQLMANCEAYISLHRSEGLGLGILEAALLGRPVVYTNYSGPVEFLAGDFFPVDFSLEPVGYSGYETGPYPKDALWARPSYDSAAQQIRAALKTSRQDRTLEVERLRQRIEKANQELVELARRLLAESFRRQERLSRTSVGQDVLRVVVAVYRKLPTPIRRVVSRLRMR